MIPVDKPPIPEMTIRMIEAFLTRYKISGRKGVATQIYNAMITVGYRHCLAPKLKPMEDAEASLALLSSTDMPSADTRNRGGVDCGEFTACWRLERITSRDRVFLKAQCDYDKKKLEQK